MKMFLLLAIICTSYAFGQVQMPTLSGRPIDWRADRFIGTDKFGYMYLVRDRELVKIHGAQQAGFQRPELGAISRADIMNPLLPMLFYQDFNTVVLLDNQLNEVRTIHFSELQKNGLTLSIRAAGVASMNRLWVFDDISRQLGLFDYSRNDFTPKGNPLQDEITAYSTNYNHFLWVDARNVMYVMDVFGKTKRIGSVPAFDSVQIISDTEVIYRNGNSLTYRNVLSGTEKLIPVVDNSFDAYFYSDQNLSIFTNHAISNYKISIP